MRNRLSLKKSDEGFTLIELLVVVVIIGVLVAIAVPVYLNYRKGAADKSAQSDVRGAMSAVEQFYASNGSTLPDSASGTNVSAATAAIDLTAASVSNPTNQTVTLSDGTQLGYVKTGSTYLICGKNTGGTEKWYVFNSVDGGSVKTVAGSLSPTTCA